MNSFSQFSDVLPSFICARTIGSPGRISLKVNIMSSYPWIDLHLVSDTILV